MAVIIVDPTMLLAGNSDAAATAGTELTIDTTAKTIKINPGTVGSDIPDISDGVTFQALYSAMKLLWKNSSTYIKFPFPFESITPEQYEVINGWSFLDTPTRKAIRTAGWAEKNSSGAVTAMYAGVVSLGSLGSTDQPYFQQVNGGTSTNFTFAGPVNEAVQVYSDPNGDGNTVDGFDYRTFFKMFARQEQKSYASTVLADIGVTTMSTIVYRFPLSNSTDLKVLHTDAQIVGAQAATYSAIDIEYFGTNQVRNIGGSPYNYRIIIDGNNKTAEQIYTKVQYLLRQSSDIDTGAGTVAGKTADSLLRFVGDTLITSTGVYIDNFDTADTNRITFTDQTAVARTFPYVATGVFSFNPNLVNDPSAVYRMYFTTNPGGNYGTSNAILVNDSAAAAISGIVSSASIAWTFSYDSNVQGGRTAATDAQVTIVAIGLSTGQFASTTATITRSTGQNIAVTSALERNFNNP